MSQRTQQYLSSKQIRGSKSPDELRKDFLNNSLESDSNEESQEVSQSNNSQSRDENVYNIHESLSQQEQNNNFVTSKDAYITKKPSNWNNIELHLGEDESSNIVSQQKNQIYNYSETPQMFNMLKKQSSSPQMNASYSSLIQIANYKKMLKNQIEKSKKLEESLYKQSKKTNYMAQLIEKLQQQNKLLRKIVHKSKERIGKQVHKISNKNGRKYCKCDEPTSSAISSKYQNGNRLCYGSKIN